MESAFHAAADFWVGVSGDGDGDNTIVVVPGPGDGEVPIDERNERSLSYGSEIEKKQGLQGDDAYCSGIGPRRDVNTELHCLRAFQKRRKRVLCHLGWQTYSWNRAC